MSIKTARATAALMLPLTLVAACHGDSSSADKAAKAEAIACVAAAADYNALADGADKDTKGAFTRPFCEEKFLSDYQDEEIAERGSATMGQTNPMPLPYAGLEHCARRGDSKYYECKPSAGSLALLPDDRLIYFNALESVENTEFSFVLEVGGVTVNDQTRVLALNPSGAASWLRPSPVDGGARNPTNNTNGGPADPLTGTSPDDPANNDGSLFCAHLINLHDGRVLAAGGSDYYTGEVEGLKSTRLFDPRTNRWEPGDAMSWGRWYPTLASLANGHVFVASGVRKLITPLYPDRPADESYRNEMHTEVFQPGCNGGRGKWTDNREPGRKSMPLYPRLHLLPNGQMLYPAAGLAWSPAGEAYDEALWNIAAAWNPATNVWTDLGVPGVGTPFPGFRGSTSNILLPLLPDANGRYPRAELLTMGGTIGTTPGSYLPVAHTRIDTVDLAAGGAMTLSSRSAGDLNKPRWFGQAVLLPSGEVLIVSGGDADEVIAPGSESAIVDPELYDPATGRWTAMARQGRPRTYHNTALLLADGRVLVGGHATHAFAYAAYFDPPTRGPEGHDPTFEIYSPPYVFAQRPTIAAVSAAAAEPGTSLTIRTPDAAAVAADGYAVLVRRGALTHLTDGDQRSVVLKTQGHTADTLSVRIPSNVPANNEAVVPPGHYMLFIVRRDGGKTIPSVSVPVRITGADLSCR